MPSRQPAHAVPVKGDGAAGDASSPLTFAAARAGATSVLTLLFNPSTGLYQALGANDEGVVELFTTENDDAVGDDQEAVARDHDELWLPAACPLCAAGVPLEDVAAPAA